MEKSSEISASVAFSLVMAQDVVEIFKVESGVLSTNFHLLNVYEMHVYIRPVLSFGEPYEIR